MNGRQGTLHGNGKEASHRPTVLHTLIQTRSVTDSMSSVRYTRSEANLSHFYWHIPSLHP